MKHSINKTYVNYNLHRNLYSLLYKQLSWDAWDLIVKNLRKDFRHNLSRKLDTIFHTYETKLNNILTKTKEKL